jgi:hypothetical protein
VIVRNVLKLFGHFDLNSSSYAHGLYVLAYQYYIDSECVSCLLHFLNESSSELPGGFTHIAGAGAGARGLDSTRVREWNELGEERLPRLPMCMHAATLSSRSYRTIHVCC